MEKVILTTIASSLMISLAAAQSRNVTVDKHDKNTQVFVYQTSKRDRLYWGPDVFWTNEAPQIKKIHVKDKSVYYGLKIGYDFLRPNCIYAGADLLYALGRTHISARKSKVQFYKDRTNGAFANGEVRLGYNFCSETSFYFTPFAGIGFYHTSPLRSTHYIQNWLYATLGLKTEYEVCRTLDVGFNVKGMRAIYLEQRIKKHKNVASNRKASDALGYAISFPITVRMGSCRNWDMRVEPYYLKLNSHSDANMVGGELTFGVRY